MRSFFVISCLKFLSLLNFRQYFNETINPIPAGGEYIVPLPLQLFLCCAKTVIVDWWNFLTFSIILKGIIWNSFQLTVTYFCQRLLGQKFQFLVKNGIFLLQNVFISDFLARIRSQRLRIDPCAKFQLNWTKELEFWQENSNFDLERYWKQLDDFILTS